MDNETRRPGVKPAEVLWNDCVELAKANEMEPFAVFERMVAVGRQVALIEKKGGRVVGLIPEERPIRLSVLEKTEKTP